jgi:hypothetical protein
MLVNEEGLRRGKGFRPFPMRNPDELVCYTTKDRPSGPVLYCRRCVMVDWYADRWSVHDTDPQWDYEEEDEMAECKHEPAAPDGHGDVYCKKCGTLLWSDFR